MVLHQHIDELLREVLGDIWVTIGDMRDEINQVAQRDDSGVVGGRGRSHEDFAVALILVVLGAEVFNVGSDQVNISIPELENFSHVEKA